MKSVAYAQRTASLLRPWAPQLQRRQMMGMAAPRVYLPAVVVDPAQRMLEAAAAMSGDAAPPCRLEAVDVSRLRNVDASCTVHDSQSPSQCASLQHVY
jgi:hypothetical protein